MSEKKATILVVDNDDGMAAALSTRLEYEGFNCVLAGSGSQGYMAFLEQDIDLVISDLNMPMGDGVTLAGRIREKSDVPIVFVTGFERDYIEELMDINNVTVLSKPFHLGHLLEVVDLELALADS